MTDAHTEQAALKPCPHCGEADQIYPGYRTRESGGRIRLIEPAYEIDCLGCGTTFTPRDGEDAIKAWNRRVS